MAGYGRLRTTNIYFMQVSAFARRFLCIVVHPIWSILECLDAISCEDLKRNLDPKQSRKAAQHKKS
jgi:hypothetical protein